MNMMMMVMTMMYHRIAMSKQRPH